MNKKIIYILLLLLCNSTLSFSQNTSAGKVKYDIVYGSFSQAKNNFIIANFSFNSELAIDELISTFGEYDDMKALDYGGTPEKLNDKTVWSYGNTWLDKKPYRNTYFWNDVEYKKWSKNKLNLKIVAGAIPHLSILDDEGNEIKNDKGQSAWLVMPNMIITITDDKQNDLLKSEYTSYKVKNYIYKLIRKVKRAQKIK